MTKWFFSLAAICLASAGLHAEIINIDNAELVRLSASGVKVIDVRTEGEWRSTGVVAGSKLMSFFDQAGRSNPPQWLDGVKKQVAPGQPVILICRSGSRSMAAAKFLSEQSGYKMVYNVSKGLNGWLGEGRSVVPAVLP
ncbi:MAG: rhodanese-like domain-containing protein [Betaproteobacteria bacterium]